MEGWSDAHCFFVLFAVFVLWVVCAIFVGVAGGEFKTHVFDPLKSEEERFRRMRGWF
jgi:hypothetical protein